MYSIALFITSVAALMHNINSQSATCIGREIIKETISYSLVVKKLQTVLFSSTYFWEDPDNHHGLTTGYRNNDNNNNYFYSLWFDQNYLSFIKCSTLKCPNIYNYNVYVYIL